MESDSLTGLSLLVACDLPFSVVLGHADASQMQTQTSLVITLPSPSPLPGALSAHRIPLCFTKCMNSSSRDAGVIHTRFDRQWEYHEKVHER